MERVLVRLPNWLGDALLARPLMHALRAAHPAAEVRAVGPAALLELLAPGGTFDRGLPWPAGGGARAALVRTLRAWRAELALVLPPSFSSAWFAWRAGARVRAGYAHEGRSWLLTHAPRRPPRGDLHLSEEYLALGAPFGIADIPPPPLAPPEAPGLEAQLARVAPRGDRFAVLGPGAIYGPAKRWSPRRFAAVGAALAARGWRIAVCGGAAERATAEEVARAIGPAAVSVAGETTLAQQAALGARASVAVCNDSGLAHLTAATGAPTVVVFGSTSSAWSAPRGDRVRVVQRAPVCSPCFRRTCRIGTPCLDRVPVEAVLAAALEVAA